MNKEHSDSVHPGLESLGRPSIRVLAIFLWCTCLMVALPQAGAQLADAAPIAPSASSGTNLGPFCVQSPLGVENWWPGDGSTVEIQSFRGGSTVGNVSFVEGKVRQAFHFDGTNAAVQSSAAFSGIDGWAMIGWVYWRGPSSAADQKGQAIFYHGHTATNGYGLFVVGPAWCQEFPDLCGHENELTILYGGVRWYFTEVVLPRETWTHVALVRSSGFLLLYLNGIPVWDRLAEDPIAPSVEFSISMPQPLTFNGAIDEVSLFSAPLNSAALTILVEAGEAGMCKGPEFTSVVRARRGYIDLETLGQRNKDITILVSPDMIRWEPILRLPNPTGVLRFSVPLNTRAEQRYYRLVPAG